MAVPTITSISLALGSTQGWAYVEIVGTNFREPITTYPPGAPVPIPTPSIAVSFGSVAALEVGWISSTLAYAVTPQAAPGVVDLTLKNLDSDGVPIPGETATLPAAFTFERPNMRLAGDAHRLIYQLWQMLKDQVFADTGYQGPHVDYRKSDSAVAQIRLPNLTLSGPTLTPNLFYSQQGNEHIPTGVDTYLTRKRRMRFDMEFQLNGASDGKAELLGMRTSLTTFFNSNTMVRIPRDPTNLGAGYAEYELVLGDEGIRDTSTLSVSSVSTFMTSFILRAVEFETVGGFAGDAIVGRGATADTLELGDLTLIP